MLQISWSLSAHSVILKDKYMQSKQQKTLLFYEKYVVYFWQMDAAHLTKNRTVCGRPAPLHTAAERTGTGRTGGGAILPAGAGLWPIRNPWCHRCLRITPFINFFIIMNFIPKKKKKKNFIVVFICDHVENYWQVIYLFHFVERIGCYLPSALDIDFKHISPSDLSSFSGRQPE